MRTLAVDGRVGASGDTLLTALLGAGADDDLAVAGETGLTVREVMRRAEAYIRSQPHQPRTVGPIHSDRVILLFRLHVGPTAARQ